MISQRSQLFLGLGVGLGHGLGIGLGVAGPPRRVSDLPGQLVALLGEGVPGALQRLHLRLQAVVGVAELHYSGRSLGDLLLELGLELPLLTFELPALLGHALRHLVEGELAELPQAARLLALRLLDLLWRRLDLRELLLGEGLVSGVCVAHRLSQRLELGQLRVARQPELVHLVAQLLQLPLLLLPLLGLLGQLALQFGLCILSHFLQPGVDLLLRNAQVTITICLQNTQLFLRLLELSALLLQLLSHLLLEGLELLGQGVVLRLELERLHLVVPHLRRHLTGLLLFLLNSPLRDGGARAGGGRLGGAQLGRVGPELGLLDLLPGLCEVALETRDGLLVGAPAPARAALRPLQLGPLLLQRLQKLLLRPL
mmetsp:Transcript_50154/g.143426  ORF Transcript_50154/g.143426 Transcript_50154/m.143426 type:complete len:370 (-) Transcript_50154:554-1663(-)